MLLGAHAIWDSASAPTPERQRRRPRTAGGHAGKQSRQFIGALVKRYRHFQPRVMHLVALHGRKIRAKSRPCHSPRETKTRVILVCGR
jgi:hypothetical protein